MSKSRRCTLVAVKCSLTSDAKRSVFDNRPIPFSETQLQLTFPKHTRFMDISFLFSGTTGVSSWIITCTYNLPSSRPLFPTFQEEWHFFVFFFFLIDQVAGMRPICSYPLWCETVAATQRGARAKYFGMYAAHEVTKIESDLWLKEVPVVSYTHTLSPSLSPSLSLYVYLLA